MINKFKIKEVRDFWDSIADEYEPSNKKVGYVHTQRFEKALEYSKLEPKQTVLNIWSRTGNLIPYVRQTKQIKLYNREVSPRFMKIAKEKYPNESFALTDLESLSEFSDNYFDRIISLETLEHTPKPLAFMKELARILKPGGIITLSCPPRASEIPFQIYELFFDNHGEGPHFFPWPHQVKDLISKSCLNLVSHKPFIILPLGNEYLTRLSEQVLTFLFRKTPLAHFGARHFYIAEK
jgi:ubiquinone/menaquinone biosynthesis C-methylase UbiE